MKKLVITSTELVSASEDFAGVYSKGAVPVRTPYHLALDLDELMPLAEAVATTQAAVMLGGWTNYAEIKSPTDNIVITESLEVSGYGNDYVASATAPPLQWFNEHRGDIEHPDPAKVYFVDRRFAVLFKQGHYREDKTLVSVVDCLAVDDFLQDIEGYRVPWLEGARSLRGHAERFGYTLDDEDKLVDVEAAIVVYYMALLQEFPDPKQVAAYFCGKELTAELVLKGVFNGIVVE